MSIENPNNPNKSPDKRTGVPKTILRAQIEEAQLNTKSNKAASRYLNVSYEVYKRYAKLYGLFEQHSNPTGVGIDKGYSHRPSSIPLREILEGKHPKYSRAKLKNRLIARKKLQEECSLCGFNERRITDNQVPLMLTHRDGDKKNYSLENLELLCYNCMFLTTGAPTVAYRNQITRSFDDPDSIPKMSKMEPIPGDAFDIEEDNLIHQEKSEGNSNSMLTEEEKRAILRELGQS
jgi:hypothetical protein